MKMPRIYVLLVVWCVLIIVPAFVVAAGVFGDLGPRMSNADGVVMLVWIIGYLAQFGVFMWIMNIAGQQKILAWFLISMLPLAVDWTLPESPSFLLLWGPVTVAIAGWVGYSARQAELMIERGVRARGVVLEVVKPIMNVVINKVYIRRKLRLRIEREDGVPPYETFYRGLFMLGEVPSPGDSIPLLIDPGKPQRLAYDKEGDKTSAKAAYAAAWPATPQSNIADELETLTNLHDRGALTDAEFDAAKKKALRR